MMNFSTLSDFNWIHRVTQDIILVLRTNKDLPDVSWIFIIRSLGTPISRSSLKDRAKFLQWNDYRRASNQPRMIAYFAPPLLV